MHLKYLGLVLFFALINCGISTAENLEYINEFNNSTPEEIMLKLDNISWIQHGVKDSPKIVYVIGAPWCPTTKSSYNYKKNNNPDNIQFRYLLTSPKDKISLKNNQILSGARDPELLNTFFTNKRIVGTPTFQDIIVYDANYLTIELLKEYLKSKNRPIRGYPSEIIFTGNDIIVGWKNRSQLMERPDAKNLTPKLAQIAQSKIKILELPKGELVTNKKTFAYTYPNDNAMKFEQWGKNLIVDRVLSLIELEDGTKWIRIEMINLAKANHVVGGWMKFDDISVY